MAAGKVIILNGIGSVGKSSTAKALQAIANDHFLHVPGDSFLDMIPTSLWNAPEGITFRQDRSTSQPSIDIEMGVNAQRVFAGMRSAVAAMARDGNNLIVDDVMLSADDQLDYQRKLEGMQYWFVGLMAPLQVLEQRERDRGDRLIGLARWQFERVHKGINYALEVDTSRHSVNESARIIAEQFRVLA
jgi:chloramphenicol 3-O phosphotransferase